MPDPVRSTGLRARIANTFRRQEEPPDPQSGDITVAAGPSTSLRRVLSALAIGGTFLAAAFTRGRTSARTAPAEPEFPPLHSSNALASTAEALYQSGTRKFVVAGRDQFEAPEAALVDRMLPGLTADPEGVTVHLFQESVDDRANALAAHPGVRIHAMRGDLRFHDMDDAVRVNPGVDVIGVGILQAAGKACPHGGTADGWHVAAPWREGREFTPVDAISPFLMHSVDVYPRSGQTGPAALIVPDEHLERMGISKASFAHYWLGQGHTVGEQALEDGRTVTFVAKPTDPQPLLEAASRTPGLILAQPGEAASSAQVDLCRSARADILRRSDRLLARSQPLADEIGRWIKAGIGKVIVGEVHGQRGNEELVARAIQGAKSAGPQAVHLFQEMPCADGEHRIMVEEILRLHRANALGFWGAPPSAPEEALLIEQLDEARQVRIHAMDFKHGAHLAPLDGFIESPGIAVASMGLSHALSVISREDSLSEPWQLAGRQAPLDPDLRLPPDIAPHERPACFEDQRKLFDGLRRAQAVAPTLLVVHGGLLDSVPARRHFHAHIESLGFRIIQRAYPGVDRTPLLPVDLIVPADIASKMDDI